jgi:putative transposase
MKRMAFLRRLRELIAVYGSQNVVYFDESGFKRQSYRMPGWAMRGEKIYGNGSGNNRRHTNLIMAQRRNKWLAPETFEGTCDAKRVNEWLEKNLVSRLQAPSIVVMDNAPFHKKKEIAAILEKYGPVLLPLPPYSPDFNPIENSFGALKRKREFAQSGTPVIDLIKTPNCYLE